MQERGAHLGEHGLGQAIEQEEEQDEDKRPPWHLGDEGDKRILQSLQHLVGARRALSVGLGMGQDVAVPQPKHDEESRQSIENEAPRKRLVVAPEALQHTRQGDEHTLSEDDGDAVERVAYAHKQALLVLVELKHVIAIGRHIVGGTEEGHEEEAAHGALEPEGRVERKGNARQRGAHQQLHDDYPPALGAIEVDKRTPDELEHPRQLQPSGVDANLGVAHSQLHIHGHGDHHHQHIGQSLGKVDRRDPCPWRNVALLHHAWFLRFLAMRAISSHVRMRSL